MKSQNNEIKYLKEQVKVQRKYKLLLLELNSEKDNFKSPQIGNSELIISDKGNNYKIKFYYPSMPWQFNEKTGWLFVLL